MGKFTVKQIMELVLSIGAVIILIMLSISLFGPSFDRRDKGAEGYFNTLMEQVAIADEGDEGEFSLWQEGGEKEMDFFLIYFGDKYVFSIGDRSFLSVGSKNILCVCYWDGKEGVCDYCTDMKYPIKYNEKYDQWIIATGERVLIKKVEENYEFIKVEK